MKRSVMQLAVNSIKVAFVLSFASVTWGQAVLEQPANPKAEKQARKKDKDSSYMRVLRNDDDEPIAMQTSIVSFAHGNDGKTATKTGVVVDLIGAVHVGDKAYYQKLNRAFKQYDALLYELVAPKDNNVPEGGESQHPVGQMQQGMKSMLDLAYQLEEVDYRKANFVHADMSPEEFSRVMSERNESWLTMMLKMMGSTMVTQSAGKSSDTDLIFAFFAKNRSLRLKRVMATQFGDLEGTMGVLEGENGSTIIGMRNKKALDVLQQQMTKGKKRIGIFYGAGHFPDMEKRMAERFGMYPNKKSIKWLTAWDMSN